MPKRCYSCMKIKENSPVCEHCGYNENVPNYPHQLPIGTLLKEQYIVGKVLGQGGFGITYIGWDTILETTVAIKEYYPGSFVNRDCSQTLSVKCNGEEAEELFRHNRERFLREARILAKLQNVPGIVRVQNLFGENNTAYIVMEYVEGIDLKHYIRMQNRVLTTAEVFSVMAPVMEALSKVHAAELVHRDISPDNIMILPDGSAKLLDFGAAREVENADVYKDLPQSTEAILKHGFAPIEQYRRRGNLGPWTDVYGLCATMYYCLTGRVPNSAPERITGDDNINWRQVPGLTEQQITVLEQAMAILPEKRVRSVEDLRLGLFAGKILSSQPAPNKPVDYPTNTIPLGDEDVPGVMETKKKKRKSAPLIAAALAAVAAAGLFLLKPKTDETVSIPETVPAITETADGTDPIALTQEQLAYQEAEALEEAGEYGKAAIAFGKLGDYEDARERSFALWDQVAQRDTLVAAEKHTVGVTEDGTVVAVGDNTNGVCNVGEWTDIIAVDAATNYTVGLKADGTAVFAGLSTIWYAPDLSQWKDIVAVSTDSYGRNILGLKMDGTVIVSGTVSDQEQTVQTWTDIVAICSSTFSDITGLKSDGTVVTTNADWTAEVADWSDIVAISSSKRHIVGLKADGTVVAVGDNRNGQCNVEDWTGIIAIDANTTDVNNGTSGTVGLKADGTIVAAGDFAETAWHDVSKFTDAVAVSTSIAHTVILKSDRTVEAVGNSSYGKCYVEGWTHIKLPNTTTPAKPSTETPASEPQNLLMSDRGPSAINGNEWEVFKTFTLLGSDIQRQKIMSVTFAKTLKDMNDTAWDISENLDGSVMAWVEKSKDNSNYYDLYIGANGKITAPENFAYFFAGYSNARSISFNDCLDTSRTTNMSNLFYGCTMLADLDVGYFDTSSVTDMSGMFCVCQNLWTLKLSNFDTSNVTNMSGMFSACQNLNTIDVSSFDTSKVTDMSNMFFRLSVLQNLDLQHFDTSKVTNMSWMFSECGKLWRLKVGTWETDSVTRYEFFFYEDRVIEGLRWLDWFEKKTAKNILMEDWDAAVTNTGDAYTHYPEYGVLGSSIKRNKVKSVTFLSTIADAPADAWDVSATQNGSVLAWTEKSTPNNNYYDLYIGAEGGVTAPESCAYLFSGYVNLREIHFGDSFDTGNTVSMQMMFHNCRSLTQLDVSSLDTSAVTDMNGMFLRCEGLTGLDISSFDTANVTDMSCMFWECRNLTSLTVSGLDTQSVTDMSYMFCACSCLTSLDISSFDTSGVVYMDWMFSECSKLTDLEVGTLETDSVKSYKSFIYDGKIINGQPWEELFA